MSEYDLVVINWAMSS